MPGEYHPGGVPVLRTDFGKGLSESDARELSNLTAGEFRSRRHRNAQGAMARAEIRAERVGRREAAGRGRDARVSTDRTSADVQGPFMASPLNPVGRQRTAGQKRKRKNTMLITGSWLDRVEARMKDEGR